ncbi:hypothetical protein GCM10007384_05280 [Aquimarina muelleri]|uniref:Uncharacterized protein n=1 Tax=Aquimarina muelleri TaxID=279356 RepID=A0A918JT98_9FLAO|nr:hypothetical protein GCM10007384_05280 [Aquimarina muelleri]
MFSFYKHPKKTLTCIDNLYNSTISKLPTENRIRYCESLIYRTTEDLSNSKCVMQKKKLNKILDAAKKELKKLKKLNM